jgi:hypothetical protein
MREGNCNIQLKNLSPRQARIATILWYDCETRQQVDAVLRIYGSEAVDVQRQILQARYDVMIRDSLDIIRVQEDLEARVEISLADAKKVLDRFL